MSACPSLTIDRQKARPDTLFSFTHSLNNAHQTGAVYCVRAVGVNFGSCYEFYLLVDSYFSNSIIASWIDSGSILLQAMESQALR